MGDYRRFDNKEFDADTGTYMEDVHANDFVGIDTDGDGLIDNVEELIEEAEVRADEYNAEQERIQRERVEREQGEHDDKADKKTDYALDAGL